MHVNAILVVVLATLAGASPALAPDRALATWTRTEPGTLAAPPLLTADTPAVRTPADSLYREARVALNRQEFRRAAELFGAVHGRYPDAAVAGPALYWHAFALYRTAESDALRDAVALLDLQAERYPEAARGDAATLRVRIQGLLARQGDVRAAEAVAARAEPAWPFAPVPLAVPRPLGVPPAAAPPGALGPPGAPPSLAETRIRAREAELAAAEMATRAWDARLVAAGFGGGATRALVVGGRPDLPEGCDRDEYEIRSTALTAVSHMRAETALRLVSRLLDDPSECAVPLRRQAVLLLHQHAAAAEPLLVDLVRRDPDVQVRRHAVIVLGQVGSETADAVLEDLIWTADDRATRANALQGLTMRGGEPAIPLLRRVALDTTLDDSLRGHAMFVLGQMQGSAGQAILWEIYPTIESPALRQRVIHALAMQGGEEQVRRLLDIAADEHEAIAVRREAVNIAGQQGASIDRLIRLYETAPGLRPQVLALVGQRIDEDAALEAIIRIAREEPDTALRRSAVFWLARSEDPRAEQALIELIEGRR